MCKKVNTGSWYVKIVDILTDPTFLRRVMVGCGSTIPSSASRERQSNFSIQIK
jgi:hypothetical protein